MGNIETATMFHAWMNDRHRGHSDLDRYSNGEVSDMLTEACRRDLSSPAKELAQELDNRGALPARRRFLIG